MKAIFLSTGLVLSTVLGVSNAAQAASFTTTLLPGSNPPKGNVFLGSIQQGTSQAATVANGRLFFVDPVDGVKILRNKGLSASSAGAAGADAGDNASVPAPTKDNLDLTDGALAAAFLGNNNLNNIIDTEDDGFFTLDLKFESAVSKSDPGFDNIFFYERGGNSDILVQALSDDGLTTIGSEFKITRDKWTPAGYSIDTLEVGGAQPVGSYGISFADLGLDPSITTIRRIRLITERNFNGADFKVVGGTLLATTTPEPTTMLGLGSIAALALLRRRQTKKVSLGS